jgi:hypothetical protein
MKGIPCRPPILLILRCEAPTGPSFGRPDDRLRAEPRRTHLGDAAPIVGACFEAHLWLAPQHEGQRASCHMIVANWGERMR